MAARLLARSALPAPRRTVGELLAQLVIGGAAEVGVVIVALPAPRRTAVEAGAVSMAQLVIGGAVEVGVVIVALAGTWRILSRSEGTAQ